MANIITLSPEIIRFIRVSNNLTLQDVANKTGASPAYIYNVEKGNTPFEGTRFERKFTELFELTEDKLAVIIRAHRDVTGCVYDVD